MILVKPKIERIDQTDYSLQGIYKQIEWCTRVSYKSEDRITEDSAEAFVKMLIDRTHYAGLEFGVVQLKLPYILAHESSSLRNRVTNKGYDLYDYSVADFFINNPYSYTKYSDNGHYLYVSTNYRVIYEWQLEDLLRYLYTDDKIVDKPCFIVTTSRDIADEMRTHRAFSWVMESSRFCNYSRDKFDNNVRFVPSSEITINKNLFDTAISPINFPEMPVYNSITENYLKSLLQSEFSYNLMLRRGLKPEIARKLLGFSFKVDLAMCGFKVDYEYFVYRRSDEHAHPDVRIISNMICDELGLYLG